MKILKQGKKPDPDWVGRRVTCDYCGCLFQLGMEDRKSVHYESDQREGDYYTVKCPMKDCRKRIYFSAQ